MVAYLGGAEELATIRRLSECNDVEVVAVALDLGDDVDLRELHDEARAAGAIRCHTLDVRDEFMRGYVLPEIDALTDDQETITALSHRFVGRKLAEMAAIEGADDVIALGQERGARPRRTRTRGPSLDRAAHVEIAFEAGVPIAINGVTMTLTEVIESLSTIAAAHGVEGRRPALAVLKAARHSLAGAENSDAGLAHVTLFAGELTACQRDGVAP